MKGIFDLMAGAKEPSSLPPSPQKEKEYSMVVVRVNTR